MHRPAAFCDKILPSVSFYPYQVYVKNKSFSVKSVTDSGLKYDTPVLHTVNSINYVQYLLMIIINYCS